MERRNAAITKAHANSKAILTLLKFAVRIPGHGAEGVEFGRSNTEHRTWLNFRHVTRMGIGLHLDHCQLNSADDAAENVISDSFICGSTDAEHRDQTIPKLPKNSSSDHKAAGNPAADIRGLLITSDIETAKMDGQIADIGLNGARAGDSLELDGRVVDDGGFKAQSRRKPIARADGTSILLVQPRGAHDFCSLAASPTNGCA